MNAALDTRIVEGARLESIAAAAALHAAWKHVKANKGGPGGDGVTLADMAADLDVHLSSLSTSILDGAYRPGKLRYISIPKKERGRRVLAIPCIRDRIVQSATLSIISPFIDPRMSDESWAYRPGRGVREALIEAQALFRSGYCWSVDADIACYFDRIPHTRLIDELTIWLDDQRIIRLFQLWVKGFGRRRVGIAQGAPVSPLLANLYLHPIDRQIVAAGFPLVRYADDLIVLAESEQAARRALALLRDLLRSRGLSLNGFKTTIQPPRQTFRFLGQDIRADGTIDCNNTA